MSEPARILLVANRTAATPRLLEAVRERVAHGPATFHLVVPRHPPGLHKIVDPQDGDGGEAEQRLQAAIGPLSDAAGSPVTGNVGSTEPLMAIEDAVNLAPYDEIVISTLPKHISRWLHIDLVSKARGIGPKVTHVEAVDEESPVP